jgi:hypothetical protein
MAAVFSGVEKKAVDTWIHKHKNGFSTWRHAELVMKTPYPTPKQPKKNKLKTKHNPALKQSCGIPKTATPT